jgi:hypothetical protein
MVVIDQGYSQDLVVLQDNSYLQDMVKDNKV